MHNWLKLFRSLAETEQLRERELHVRHVNDRESSIGRLLLSLFHTKKFFLSLTFCLFFIFGLVRWWILLFIDFIINHFFLQTVTVIFKYRIKYNKKQTNKQAYVTHVSECFPEIYYHHCVISHQNIVLAGGMLTIRDTRMCSLVLI